MNLYSCQQSMRLPLSSPTLHCQKLLCSLLCKILNFIIQLVKLHYTQELWINTAAVLQMGVVVEDIIRLKNNIMRIKSEAWITQQMHDTARKTCKTYVLISLTIRASFSV